MRIGITGIAPYLPTYRLTGEQLRAVWGQQAGGSRAVANYDEDAITMAVAALAAALDGRSGQVLDALFFASVTPPFWDKGCANLVAAAVDAKQQLRTADFAGALRAGTSALRAGFDAVAAGGVVCTAVTAADVRVGMPGTPLEATLGDGGAAVLVGREGCLAELLASHSISDEFTDFWRREGERYPRAGDARFVQEYGYQRLVSRGLRELVAAAGVEMGAVTYFAYQAPDLRTHLAIARELKLSAEQVAGADLYNEVGTLGTAAPLLGLIDALSRCQPGDLIAVAGYGSGVDALLFCATPAVTAWQRRNLLGRERAKARPIATYGRYLAFRRLVDGEEVAPYTSLMLAWREQEANLRRHAPRCLNCGSVHFPPERICPRCGAKERFERVRLADTGRVVTFTSDHLPPFPDPPVTMAVVDLDGGGRFYTQLVEADPAQLRIGMPVRFVFRKVHEGGALHHYFWKFAAEGEAGA